jgi:hypothetical protein
MGCSQASNPQDLINCPSNLVSPLVIHRVPPTSTTYPQASGFRDLIHCSANSMSSLTTHWVPSTSTTYPQASGFRDLTQLAKKFKSTKVMLNRLRKKYKALKAMLSKKSIDLEGLEKEFVETIEGFVKARKNGKIKVDSFFFDILGIKSKRQTVSLQGAFVGATRPFTTLKA